MGRWEHRVPNASSSSDISKLLIGFPEGVANGEVKSPDVVRLGTASGGLRLGREEGASSGGGLDTEVAVVSRVRSTAPEDSEFLPP